MLNKTSLFSLIFVGFLLFSLALFYYKPLQQTREEIITNRNAILSQTETGVYPLPELSQNVQSLSSHDVSQNIQTLSVPEILKTDQFFSVTATGSFWSTPRFKLLVLIVWPIILVGLLKFFLRVPQMTSLNVTMIKYIFLGGLLSIVLVRYIKRRYLSTSSANAKEKSLILRIVKGVLRSKIKIFILVFAVIFTYQLFFSGIIGLASIFSPEERHRKRFHRAMDALRPPGRLNLVVDRSNNFTFEPIFNILNPMSVDGWRRRVDVFFLGEVARDLDGVSREFFHLYFPIAFNRTMGYFCFTDSNLFAINPTALIRFPDEGPEMYRFLGKVLAWYAFNGHFTPGEFISFFYALLLDRNVEPTRADLRAVDLEFYNNLIYILSPERTAEEFRDVLCLTMTYNVPLTGDPGDGRLHTIELVANGQTVDVTLDNREEYVRLTILSRLKVSIEPQMNYLREGFNFIIPPEALASFSSGELRDLLCGSSTLDLNDWRQYSIYPQNDQVVTWFWRAVREMTMEDRILLLEFVTGSSRVPPLGFQSLTPRFTIQHEEGTPGTTFPRTHTCFNRIDLYDYTSFENLQEMLLRAIRESRGFGLL